MGCVCGKRRVITTIPASRGQVSSSNTVKFCPKCASRITVIPVRGEGGRMFYQYVPCGCGR
jgi:hypothetical protein